jgi:dual specificity tyrosine-phosphorylation-regulated kinase 2/3/4
MSRSTSATSSLDPYYFGVRSPADSPPPLPDTSHFRADSEIRHYNPPVTPARDPAAIDRRGLVGVGELTTPRWTKVERYGGAFAVGEDELEEDEDDGMDVVIPVEEKDAPDSPWTIEAVDGESDWREEVRFRRSICRYQP